MEILAADRERKIVPRTSSAFSVLNTVSTMALSQQFPFPLIDMTKPPLTSEGLIQTDPAALADALDAEAWATHPAGGGSKGLRLYDWARIPLPRMCEEGFKRWVLIRRNRRKPDKLAADLRRSALRKLNKASPVMATGD